MKRFLFYYGKQAILFLLSLLGFSCGAFEIEYGPEEPDIVPPKDLNNYETFTARNSEIVGRWHGEYSGYDSHQKDIVNIRRLLILNSDGTYINRIQGCFISKSVDKNQYTDFEYEVGTYYYDESNEIVFSVYGDSLIDYNTGQMRFYKLKHSYSGEEGTQNDVEKYSEPIAFAVENNNDTVWITRDAYLQNNKGDDLELLFLMKKGNE